MIAYAAMTLFFGAIVTIHVSMNARIGSIIGSPSLSNCIFWGIGFITAMALTIGRVSVSVWNSIARVDPYLFAAGLLGSVLALFNTWIIPKVGITIFSLLIILGQLIASYILARTGFLGVPVEASSPMKLAGLCIATVGVVVFVLGR